MERIFQLAAAMLAGIAVFFLWQENGDGAFIAAVFGAVCFFLSVRFQVKERMKQRGLAAETDYGQLSENSVDEENLIAGEVREKNKNRI